MAKNAPAEKKTFDNSNRGVLWNNDDKNSENSPDRRGNILLVVDIDDILDNGDGTATIHRYLAAWDSESKKGDTYISLAIGKAVPATHGSEDE